MASEKKPSPKDPRKAPRQERSRATVNFIVDATHRLIAEKGVAELRIADVAERAGVAVASIYQYFPTREALLAAWEESSFEKLFAALVARATTIHEERLPLDESVFELSLRGLELFAAHARSFDGNDNRVSRREERVRLMDAAIQMFTTMLEERAREEPRLAGKDIPLCARVAVHTIVALGYEAHLRTAGDVEAYDRQVAQMVTSLFLGPAPPPLEPEASA